MLKNKSAVITGSSSGIGLGIAEGFAKAGINVMMNGIEPAEQVEEDRARLESYGVKAVYSQANMMKGEEVRQLIADATDQAICNS